MNKILSELHFIACLVFLILAHLNNEEDAEIVAGIMIIGSLISLVKSYRYHKKAKQDDD